jgi:hypothetical protein
MDEGMLSKAEKEDMSANRLEAHLRTLGHSVTHSRGSEPPDFWFEVDGAKWAVEVTELHQFDINEIPLPAIGGIRDKVAELVRSELAARGEKLHRTIFIHLERHISRLEMNSIASKIIAAIPAAGPQARSYVFPNDSSIFVTTGGSEDPQVLITSLAGWQDIESQRVPVEKALADKMPILKSIAKGVTQPVLVLLLEAGMSSLDHGTMIAKAILDTGIDAAGIRIFYSGWHGVGEVNGKVNGMDGGTSGA